MVFIYSYKYKLKKVLKDELVTLHLLIMVSLIALETTYHFVVVVGDVDNAYTVKIF